MFLSDVVHPTLNKYFLIQRVVLAQSPCVGKVCCTVPSIPCSKAIIMHGIDDSQHGPSAVPECTDLVNQWNV